MVSTSGAQGRTIHGRMSMNGFFPGCAGRASPWLAVLAGAWSLAGCATTTSAETFDLTGRSSYRWRQDPVLLGTEPTAMDQAALEQLRAIVDRELGALGLQRMDKGDAELAVRAVLRTELLSQQNDPYFSLYVAEQYELGKLQLEFQDGTSGERLWRGECRHRLRTVQRVVGGSMQPQAVPTNEPRIWPIEEMARRVLQLLRRQ